MSNQACERLRDVRDTTSGLIQPTSTNGGRQAVREGSSPTMEHALTNITDMLQRLSNGVDIFAIELSQVRDHVDNDFMHCEGRVNKG
jgi:hypothetical protein